MASIFCLMLKAREIKGKKGGKLKHSARLAWFAITYAQMIS
jgi:hypothetical protein